MAKLLWTFTVTNPSVKEEKSDVPAVTPLTKSRFGARHAQQPFQLPSVSVNDTTVFQVYLLPSSRHGTSDSSSSLEVTDYAHEIDQIIKSKAYAVALVATTAEGKIFNATVRSKTLRYLLAEGFPQEEEKHRLDELNDSLMAVLFGLQVSRPPPLWLTTAQLDNDGTMVLEIRRGYRESGPQWSPRELKVLGRIPLQEQKSERNSDSGYNMLIQGANQLSAAKTQILKLEEQRRMLNCQLEEFQRMKEITEADLLEKMLMLLNKKKEKFQQLKQGVDIPDDDEDALYDYYSRISEYSGLPGYGRASRERQEIGRDESGFDDEPMSWKAAQSTGPPTGTGVVAPKPKREELRTETRVWEVETLARRSTKRQADTDNSDADSDASTDDELVPISSAPAESVPVKNESWQSLSSSATTTTASGSTGAAAAALRPILRGELSSLSQWPGTSGEASPGSNATGGGLELTADPFSLASSSPSGSDTE